MQQIRIRLPHNGWQPRPHQTGLWSYLETGGKRAIAIWHRRAGKDEVCLHWAAVSIIERPGSYWHMLPEYAQGRKAIWTAVNPHTKRRRIDEAFPRELRESTNEQEMFIRFRNGSTWQVVGSDRFDSLVGSSPAGIVFSEWALAHPSAWSYLAPILAENEGWATFITTPRGRNHAYDTYNAGCRDSAWFAERLTVDDTGIIPQSVIEADRRNYIDIFGEDAGNALIEQEYWCSFEAAVLGAYWGKQMAEAEREGRIGKIEVDRDFPIHTAWDIGVDDPMAIWVFQVFPGRIHVVDYYESSGYGFDHYCDWLNERSYNTGYDWVPHDALMREVGAPGARTRIESLIHNGRANPQPIEKRRRPKKQPDHKLMDGINAARKTIPLCWFDEARCKKGLEHLREYKADWDEIARVFRKTPKHDQHSHGADAFRGLAISWREPMAATEDEPMRGTTEMTMDEAWKLARVKQGEARI